MTKDPDKEEEIDSIFSDYNYNRAKAEGLWKKAGRSFKKFLAKLHRDVFQGLSNIPGGNYGKSDKKGKRN